ncbi:hypothetical protein C8R47DRAFT_596829 [Mycena vitilis]|nr:hypothetical protein C8R47DRAFT_596829 [Mycena vitilis]
MSCVLLSSVPLLCRCSKPSAVRCPLSALEVSIRTGTREMILSPARPALNDSPRTGENPPPSNLPHDLTRLSPRFRPRTPFSIRRASPLRRPAARIQSGSSSSPQFNASLSASYSSSVLHSASSSVPAQPMVAISSLLCPVPSCVQRLRAFSVSISTQLQNLHYLLSRLSSPAQGLFPATGRCKPSKAVFLFTRFSASNLLCDASSNSSSFLSFAFNAFAIVLPAVSV